MTPLWFYRHLFGGERGPDVRIVNRKLGIVGETYGPDAQAYVRGLQQMHGLVITGMVDEDTAVLLGEAADADLPPEWFRRDLELGLKGPDVSALRERLELPAGEVFDDVTRRAVLRLQSSRSLPLTGKVDSSLSLLLP